MFYFVCMVCLCLYMCVCVCVCVCVYIYVCVLYTICQVKIIPACVCEFLDREENPLCLLEPFVPQWWLRTQQGGDSDSEEEEEEPSEVRGDASEADEHRWCLFLLFFFL